MFWFEKVIFWKRMFWFIKNFRVILTEGFFIFKSTELLKLFYKFTLMIINWITLIIVD